MKTSGYSDQQMVADSTVHRVGSIRSVESLSTIDYPPEEEHVKAHHPFSVHVLALLMPASILGALARLGLEALAAYDGQSVFPLAYVQATGCFIMGLGVGMKAPFGRL